MVDQNALRIWFGMWPEVVRELVADGDDLERRLKFFQMNGRFRLADVADTSHSFLYGHRYWVAVKQALASETGTNRYDRICAVASRSGAPVEFSLAMTAIAQMTLEQCGPTFLSSEYEPVADGASPKEWLKRRASGLRPSLMERLKGKSACERVLFDEQDEAGWFPILATQDITTAAELDKRAFHERDARCYEGMGPIPVDCRSGSCGTCWVGILGGNENLDPVEEFEQKRIEYFGYWDSGFVDSTSERPLIRLACQTRANGSVSIVIPPWNGVFGRSRREKEIGS
jgi:ferredoxin